jgi:16S rRNA (uracil1498-N3)-methyltransferase
VLFRSPLVEPVSEFSALSRMPGMAMADLGGEPPALDHPAVLIGPEGGWSEVEAAAGLPRVDLGPHVLRAETAAVAAAAVLAALRAGLVR